MSRRQFITLRTHNSNEEVDIELPGDQPVRSLLPDLLKVLNWPVTNGSQPIRYYLQNETGDRIKPDLTFNEAGIENFDVLWILMDNTEPIQSAGDMDAGSRIPGQDPYAAAVGEDEADVLPPPVWAGLPIDQPCLVSDSGLIFMLGQSALVVGRRSRENNPEIDLTEMDSGFISSRRHAEIVFTNGRHILRAFNTRNGMLVNGTKLTPGEPWELKDGDMLQFGFRGVQLVYRLPKK